MKDFCFFFFFFSCFLFAQNCKIQLHSKHTNTQSARYTSRESHDKVLCSLSSYIHSSNSITQMSDFIQ
jgi:hypothetical protein